MPSRSQDLVAWLRTRVAAAGASGLVVPLAGTVQAAVVGRLSQLASPDAVITVGVRSLDPAADLLVALVHDYLQLPSIDVSAKHSAALVQEIDAALAGLPHRRVTDAVLEGAPSAELPPRLATAALYYTAGSLNYLVAGTLDRTDLTLGAFEKHGQAAVDLLPLGNMARSDVLALGRELQVPQLLVDPARPAGDARASGAGVTHKHLEWYLANGPDGVAPAVALKIERMMRESDRKRSAAEIPDAE